MKPKRKRSFFYVETTTFHRLAEGYNKEAVVAEARRKEPSDTLIGVEKRPNGSSCGFFVGKLPADFGC